MQIKLEQTSQNFIIKMQNLTKNWERVSFGSKIFQGKFKNPSRSLNLGSLSRDIISHRHLIHRFRNVLQRTVFSESTLQRIRTQSGRNRRLGFAKRSIRLDPLKRSLFMWSSRVRKGLESNEFISISGAEKEFEDFISSSQFWTNISGLVRIAHALLLNLLRIEKTKWKLSKN